MPLQTIKCFKCKHDNTVDVEGGFLYEITCENCGNKFDKHIPKKKTATAVKKKPTTKKKVPVTIFGIQIGTREVTETTSRKRKQKKKKNSIGVEILFLIAIAILIFLMFKQG